MSDAPLKGWHHTPNVPLQVSPFFQWPPQLKKMLAWFWGSWFFLSERLIVVGIAFATLHWTQPPLHEVQTFSFGWSAQMFLRNVILMRLVAGGLHLYFYRFTKCERYLNRDSCWVQGRGVIAFPRTRHHP